MVFLISHSPGSKSQGENIISPVMLESNWSFNSSPRVLHHFLYHRVVEDGAIQHSFPTFKLRAIISTLINIGRHEKIRLPQSCAVLTKTAKSFGIVQNNRGLGGMVTQCFPTTRKLWVYNPANSGFFPASSHVKKKGGTNCSQKGV